MIFLSAGHYRRDPGAVANGLQENNLTIELRDLVVKELLALGQVLGKNFKVDNDDWDLRTYLHNLHSGTGSVVFEIHFDSGSPKASGCTMIVPNRGWTQESTLEYQMGDEISKATSFALQLPNHGVIDETKSARGKLGIMRPLGINGLLEVGFITNQTDITHYNTHKFELAKTLAKILVKYDSLK